MNNKTKHIHPTHELITLDTCQCNPFGEERECPICDWHLSVCRKCHKAEKDLFIPCGAEMMRTKVMTNIAGVDFRAEAYDQEGLVELEIERMDENGDHYFVKACFSPLSCKEISNFFLALSHTIKLGDPDKT